MSAKERERRRLQSAQQKRNRSCAAAEPELKPDATFEVESDASGKPSALAVAFRIEKGRRLSTQVPPAGVRLYRRLLSSAPEESIAAFAIDDECHGLHTTPSGWAGISLSSEAPTAFIQVADEKVPDVDGLNCTTIRVPDCESMMKAMNNRQSMLCAIANNHSFIHGKSLRNWNDMCDGKFPDKLCQLTVPPSAYYVLDWDKLPPEFAVVRDRGTHYTIIPAALLDAYKNQTPLEFDGPEALWKKLAPQYVVRDGILYGWFSQSLFDAFDKLPYWVMKGGADPTYDFEPDEDDDIASCEIMVDIIRCWWPYIETSDSDSRDLCHAAVNLHRCNPPRCMWQTMLDATVACCSTCKDASQDVDLAAALSRAREWLRDEKIDLNTAQGEKVVIARAISLT